MMIEVSPRITRLLVTAIGLAGFLGLLLAGNAVPVAASMLRSLALIWFLAFGVLRCSLDWKR